MRTIACGVALVGLLALAAPPSPGGVTATCAPPRLGFGVGEGANDVGMPPTVGELRIAMLFVDFADRPASDSPDALFDALVPPSVAWYRAASYDRLRLVVDPLRRWLRMPRSLGEYESAHFAGAVEDVLAAADPHYDFGDVDALYLITSQEAGSLASAVVDQDVMSGAGGAGLLAWHRWKLGWLSVKDVLCLARRRPVVASLAPLARPGGRKAIVYRTRIAAVVVEVRSRAGIDRSLCKPGVLVYRIDFRKGAPASIGKLGVPIDIWQAHTGSSPRCGSDWRAPLALGRGNVARAVAFGVEIRLLRRLRDGTYRVRVS